MSLLMVPLTLKCLGVYQNGVWLTLSSILMWIDLMDIGLGNGLRNAVAQYRAEGRPDMVRKAISSTFAMLALIAVPIIGLLAFIVNAGDVYALLSVDRATVRDLQLIITVAGMLVASTFVMKTVGNVYMGLQLPAVNNLLLALGATLALVLTALAYVTGYHTLMDIVIINTLSSLCVWTLSYVFTFYHKY